MDRALDLKSLAIFVAGRSAQPDSTRSFSKPRSIFIARAGGALAVDVVGLSPDTEPRIAAEACHFVLSCFGKQIL